MFTRKLLSIVVLSVLSVLILTSCISKNVDKTDKTSQIINIGSFSRAIDYAPYIIAKNRGLFAQVAEKYGMKINYVEFQTLPSINEAFGSKNLDIVFEAEPPAIIGKAAGIDIKIVSPGVSLTQEILVPMDSDVLKIADLKGKKIAVPSGSSSHYGLNKLLSQAGLTKEDVEIIDMNPQDGQAAFVSGQIDGWAIWPPFVEQQEYDKTGRVLKGSDVFIQSIVVMRTGFMKENPELAKALISALNESQQWILDNTEEAQQIVANELGIKLAVVKLAWGKHNFNPTIGAAEISDIQDKANFLYDMGLVKTKIDVASELIDLY